MSANKIALQWVFHAEEDIRLAKHAFKLASAVPYKLIAFHAQQCAEKYLKALLIFKKVDFPYTHNISLLLELCEPLDILLRDMDDAKTLTFYAVTARYPGNQQVTRQEALQAVSVADLVRKRVRRILRKERLKLQ